MVQKLISIAVAVCVLVVIVQSAPQINKRGSQRFGRTPIQPQFNNFQQPQPAAHAQEPERQSRFLVVEDKFNKEPNGEYQFE